MLQLFDVENNLTYLGLSNKQFTEVCSHADKMPERVGCMDVHCNRLLTRKKNIKQHVEK